MGELSLPYPQLFTKLKVGQTRSFVLLNQFSSNVINVLPVFSYITIIVKINYIIAYLTLLARKCLKLEIWWRNRK